MLLSDCRFPHLICFMASKYLQDVWISALVLSSATDCFTDNFTLCWVEMCSWEKHVLNFQIENYLLRNHETRKYLQEQAYRLQQGIVTSTTQQVRGHDLFPHTLNWPFWEHSVKDFIIWLIPSGTIRTGFFFFFLKLTNISRVWGTM